MESSADIYVLRKAEQALQVLGGREKVSKLLQEVKERVSKLVDFEEAPGSAMYSMRKEHIVWLISQAEKVEQLEQENEKEQKRLKNQIYKTVEEKFLLEKQLRQAQKEIELLKLNENSLAEECQYYRDTLGKIIETSKWGNVDTALERLVEIAKRALEGEEK